MEEALSLQRKPLDEAQEKLNQASAELTAAESEYDEKRSEAYVQLDAAALEIESAKAVSSGALGEVEAGLSQMIDAELQLQLELESGAVTDAEYWEKVAQLSETKAELEANKLILLQSEAELELAAAALSQKRQETEISLGEGKVQLDGARAEFEAGLAEFEAGKAQFDSAKRTAMQPLLEAKEALDSGEREYKTGYDTWLAGKQTLEREKRQSDSSRVYQTAVEANELFYESDGEKYFSIQGAHADDAVWGSGLYRADLHGYRDARVDPAHGYHTVCGTHAI